MADKFQVWNEDCIDGSKTRIGNEKVDLIICDPPFGLNETKFDALYKRNKDKVLDGYVEAPEDYYQFSLDWMTQAKRILKPNGSMYVIIGHTPLIHILNAAGALNLKTVNHCVWKFNFGTNTSTKFVTSHYHVLYFTKPKAKPTFNTYCRFGPQEKEGKHSLLYQDLEDVFVINKDFAPDQVKNVNKLPNALIEKLVLYSSNPGDTVVDFFMGNFTTAYVSLSLGRGVLGFELNQESFRYHKPRLKDIKFGSGLSKIKKVEVVKPKNQGKPVTEEERLAVKKEYDEQLRLGVKKKDISVFLSEKFGRGRFSIKNILDSFRTEKTP
jgi:site-specific DNA-methyltransferase (adenine-specific)